MSLTKKSTETTKATAFEAMDESPAETMTQKATEPTTETVTHKATESVAEAPVNAIAVAAPRTGALTTAKAITMASTLSVMKDALHVDYDSLPCLGATQGSFTVKTDDAELGSEIKLQLLSFQDSYVCSPNDEEADKELVKYSDDGVTAKDGTDMKAHLEDLRQQGFKNAKISHRVVLVGELLSSQEPHELVGQLVQIDLPETGRRAFNTYSLQASYAVAKGKKTAEEAAVLTLKAIKDKSRDGKVFTKVAIS